MEFFMIKNIFFRNVILLTIIMESVIFFSGCSFPFQSKNEIQLTDISDELNFQNLKHNAFMG